MLTQSADTITVETFPGSPLQRATRLLGPSAASGSPPDTDRRGEVLAGQLEIARARLTS
jgi:hypothetical protein